VLGKGGTGKSTVAVLLTRELARRGYRVCLLDADSTSTGLHRALGSADPPLPLIDYFGGMVFRGGPVSCPVMDPSPLAGMVLSIADLPQEYVARPMDGVILLMSGKLGANGTVGGCDGPLVTIARDLTASGPEGDSVTVVDFKGGMEDTVRGALSGTDLALAVIDPTLPSVAVAGKLVEAVRQIRAGTPPNLRHLEDPEGIEVALATSREMRITTVLAILNRVPDANIEVRLAGRVLEGSGLKPVGSLREDPTVGMAWLEGSRVVSHENQARIRRIVDRIEDVAQGWPPAVGPCPDVR